MLLVMNTENTRVLASTYEERSDGALNLQFTLNQSLELAALDDTYDVSGSLTALSEELHIGGVVLAHQADIMDGLVVDVDALAEELDVQPWEIRQQLKRADKGTIDLGEVLTTIVDWGGSTTVGLDTTIRDFVPDAPELGEDPEFDALIQRLDGWLLSAVVDDRPLDELLQTPDREADMIALATRMGMRDLSTVIVHYTETRWQGNSDDGRDVTYDLERSLEPEEYLEWTFDWLRPRLVQERKLSRVAVLPTLGELFDFTILHYTTQEKDGGDSDYYDVERTRNRSAQQIADMVERVNTEFADLAWLPGVLAGLDEPPPDALTPEVQKRINEMIHTFRPQGVIPDFNHQTFSGGRYVVARALENPRPIQKARLPFAAEALSASIEFGRQQGVVTEQHEAEARQIAQYLTGFDPNTDIGTLTADELAEVAPDLDVQEFVGLLATRINPEQLTENRIIQAYTYAQRGETVGDRIERIEQAILGFQTVVTVGEPAMTKHDWLSALPDKVRLDDDFTHTDIQAREFNWLLDHVGVPGYHKSRDWRKGKGKRYYHLVNDEVGAVDDFVVEIIPKKQPWWSKAIFTVAKVAMSIAAPPLGVAIAAMDAVIAANQGDWLGAGLAALGAITAGTAAWASTTASAATTATANAVATADAVRTGAMSASAMTAANSVATAATSTANLANAVASGAQFVNAGVRAGVAIHNDDLVGGIVGSVGALAAGANGFGSPDVAANLVRVGQGIQAVDTTVKAIEGDDIAGAIAGGLSAGAAFSSVGANAAEGADLIGADTNQTLQRVATTAQATGGLVGSGAAIVQGVEDEQWGALVGQGLRFGSSAANLVADQNGVVSGLVYDRSDPDAFAASTTQLQDYASYGAIAADFADGGLAIANEDYLGGAALISGGTTALVKDTQYESKHFTRLDQLTSIADTIVKAGPDVDPDVLGELITGDVAGFVETFRPDPESATLRAGDPTERLREVRVEKEAAAASLAVLDNLLAIGSQGATATRLLQAQRAELAGDLGLLEQEQLLAEEAYVVTAENSLPAPALPTHVPTSKPAVPSHVPMPKPLLPDHIPVFRPDDLFAADPLDGLLVPGPYGTFAPAPRPPVQGPMAPISLDSLPATSRARIYEDWLRLGHPSNVVPDGLGDYGVSLTGVGLGIPIGPYKVPLGGFATGTVNQETFGDGRKGIGYQLKYGTRVGVDGPLPILPGLQVGYAHDDLTSVPDWMPVDLPLGGWAFQSIGPEPGVVPDQMYDLAVPWQWPVGASVRLNEFTGDEYHFKVGNSGPLRLSLFDDEIRHLVDSTQVTNLGDHVEVSDSQFDQKTTDLGFALNIPLPDSIFGIALPEEIRFAASQQFGHGSSATEAVRLTPAELVDHYVPLLGGADVADHGSVIHTDSEFGTQQYVFDLSLGEASPRFDSRLSLTKPVPHSQYLVSNSLYPDGHRTSDYTTSGLFWNRASTTTTVGDDGSIDDIRIETAITPLFGDEIPITLGKDDVIAFLEADRAGGNPIEALRGRVPDEAFATPMRRVELLDTMRDIQEGASDDELNPHFGNLSVREDHHGNRRLEMTNPYPGMLIDDIAADYPFLNIKNRPIVNDQIRAHEVMSGIGDGLGIVWDGVVDGAKYAHYGTAYGGVKLAESIGLGDWVGETDRSNAAVFEQQYLEGTIEAGRQTADYVSSRAVEPSLLLDDAIAFDESVDEWVATTKQAWREGDGEYFGRGIAYAGAGAASVLTGVGAPALTARGTSTLGRVANRLGGRGGGDGLPPGGDADGFDGPDRASGDAANRADFERYVAELGEREVMSHGGSTSRANYERLIDHYAAENLRPPVTDRELSAGFDELFRPGAEVGNGSTGGAARFELDTGRPVGGALHHTKAQERAEWLRGWLARNPMEPQPGQNVPKGRRSDRAAAQNVLRDLDNYLAEERASVFRPRPTRKD